MRNQAYCKGFLGRGTRSRGAALKGFESQGGKKKSDAMRTKDQREARRCLGGNTPTQPHGCWGGNTPPPKTPKRWCPPWGPPPPGPSFRPTKGERARKGHRLGARSMRAFLLPRAGKKNQGDTGEKKGAPGLRQRIFPTGGTLRYSKCSGGNFKEGGQTVP